MLVLDPVISTDSDYTELIRVTHSAELMLSSQQTSIMAGPHGFSVLVVSAEECRQSSRLRRIASSFNSQCCGKH